MSVIRLFLLALLGALVAVGLAAFIEQTRYRGTITPMAPGASGEVEVAVIANSVAGTVSLIDVERAELIKTLDVTPDGRRAGLLRDPVQYVIQPIAEGQGGLNYAQDTDVSPDGRTLYVSRGFLGDVAAFDIASGALVWRRAVSGIRADHMDISPAGDRLYVSAMIRGGNVVEVFDAYTGQHLAKISTAPWPHDVHVSADGARVYVASLGDMELSPEERDTDPDAYSITIANAVSGEILDAHRFSAGVRPFVLVGDEQEVIAQLTDTHGLVRYDFETRAVTRRLDLPIAEGVTADDWDFEAPHHGLAYSDQLDRLCVAGRASDYAGLVEASALELVTLVTVGDAPSWAAVAADGETCLLANTRSADVSFVDMRSGSELARIDAGLGAKHITIAMMPTALFDPN